LIKGVGLEFLEIFGGIRDIISLGGEFEEAPYDDDRVVYGTFFQIP